MCYFSPASRLESSWNLVPQSCVMNASLSFILSSFQSEGNYAFVNTAIRWNKFQLLQACLRGKSSTLKKWHCLRIIALESKRLIHTLWTWCQITWKRIFYPIQQKSMVFNQECRWNNGSKSLHSFWATLYISTLMFIPSTKFYDHKTEDPSQYRTLRSCFPNGELPWWTQLMRNGKCSLL